MSFHDQRTAFELSFWWFWLHIAWPFQWEYSVLQAFPPYYSFFSCLIPPQIQDLEPLCLFRYIHWLLPWGQSPVSLFLGWSKQSCSHIQLSFCWYCQFIWVEFHIQYSSFRLPLCCWLPYQVGFLICWTRTPKFYYEFRFQKVCSGDLSTQHFFPSELCSIFRFPQ